MKCLHVEGFSQIFHNSSTQTSSVMFILLECHMMEEQK